MHSISFTNYRGALVRHFDMKWKGLINDSATLIPLMSMPFQKMKIETMVIGTYKFLEVILASTNFIAYSN